MKKLTLEQALKTPNIKFRANYKQIQEIINRTPSWTCNTTPVIGFTMRNDCSVKPMYYMEENSYNNSSLEEVEIIEEESNAFNSQQEIWQWLSSNEDVKCNWGTLVVGFKDNKLWNFTIECISKVDFSNYKQWTKYKEPEFTTVNEFQVPKPIKELSEFKLANLLIEEGIHSNSENAYIHAQAMLGCVDQ